MSLVILLVVVAILATIVTLGRRAQRAAHEQASALALSQVAARVSHRLDIRRPVLSDLAFYVEMAGDPIAAEANGWPDYESAMMHQRFATPAIFDRMRRSEFVAIERVSNTRVSTVRFAPSPLDPDTARSIGIHVHPDHRNKGYGREVTAAAILLLQRTPDPVHVGTRTTNHGMQQIMRQLGYEHEPTPRAYVAPNGESYESYWYHCGADVHEPVGLLADQPPTRDP